MSANHYAANPWLFGSITIACVTFIALLLAQGLGVFGTVTQGEPTAVNLLAIRQSGMFYATGVQTSQDMENLARECLGIKELPPPSALVRGDARDRANWKELTPTEASKIAEADRAAVGEKLREIIKTIAGNMVEQNVVWGPQKAAGESDSGPVPKLDKENPGK